MQLCLLPLPSPSLASWVLASWLGAGFLLVDFLVGFFACTAASGVRSGGTDCLEGGCALSNGSCNVTNDGPQRAAKSF